MRACPDLPAHDPGALEVRSKQPHALTHRLVNDSARPVAQHLQDRGACVRLLEGNGYKVYRSLRFHPLAIEACCQEIRMRHDIGDADRLFRREREMTIEQKVQLHISVAIKLAEAGIRCRNAHGSRSRAWLASLDRMVAAHPPTKSKPAPVPAAERRTDRRVVDLAQEGRESICVEDRHRPDDAICVWPAPAREISIRGLAKETGRQSPPSTRRKRCNEMLEYRTSSLRNVNRRMRLGRFRQRLG